MNIFIQQKLFKTLKINKEGLKCTIFIYENGIWSFAIHQSIIPHNFNQIVEHEIEIEKAKMLSKI